MISAGGVEPDGDSYSADITADGRRIVFVSTAGNLAAGDADGQSDIFVADRDVRRRFVHLLSLQEATLNDAAQQFQHPKISGNGSAIIYRDIRPPDPLRPGDNLYIQRTNALGNGSSANNFPGQTSRFVKDADIDYSGLIVAEVGSNICGNDTVIVIQLAAQSLAVAVGTPYIDQTVGGITSVAISADASTVAWSRHPAADHLEWNDPARARPARGARRPPFVHGRMGERLRSPVRRAALRTSPRSSAWAITPACRRGVARSRTPARAPDRRRRCTTSTLIRATGCRSRPPREPRSRRCT